MLCVLVGTETKAVSVSLLVCVLFLTDSEAFPAGKTQCLVRHVVVRTPALTDLGWTAEWWISL